MAKNHSDAIRMIVIHCSDSPDQRDVGFDEINQWHLDRGFDSGVKNDEGVQIYCGYHFIVRKDGTIEKGRPEEIMGSHVKGWNDRSISICWIGQQVVTFEQGVSLMNLCSDLMSKYKLELWDVYGHFELAVGGGKTCPNFHFETSFPTMNNFRKRLDAFRKGGMK